MLGKYQFLLMIFLIGLTAAGAPSAVAAPEHKPSPHYSIKKIKRLREGKFRAIVDGVLCNSCTRAIVERLKEIKGIANAEFDFEEGYLWITVAPKAEVRTGKVLRALRLAARKNNLGTRFSITEIRNVE